MPKHDTQAVWYEPHPVTSERKAAIRAMGFRVLDAVFKPVDHENPDVPELKLDAAEKPAKTDPVAPKKLSVDELRAALVEKGVEIPEGAKKADLQALLDAAEKPAE